MTAAEAAAAKAEAKKKIVRFEGIRLKEARPVRRTPRHELPKQDDNPEAMPQQAEPLSPPMATIDHPEDAELQDKVEELPLDSIQTLIKEAHLEVAQGRQQTKGVIIDSIPRYPTGINDFMRWLSATMVYPTSSRLREESGRVVAAFIVEADGSITDIHIETGVSRELNREVVRVLKKMPKWIPGQKNGRPIRAQVTLPVEFQLNEIYRR